METGKHLVRYSARERENLFEVVTDDPFVYDGVPESYIDERVKSALDTFDKEGVLCSTLRKAFAPFQHILNSRSRLFARHTKRRA